MRKAHSHRANKFGSATRPKRADRKARQIRSAAFEALEGRTLLSSAVTFTGSAALDATGNTPVYASLANPTATPLAQVAQSPLAGSVIGTSGSFANQGNTIGKAFDGSLSSFFDAPSASGGWVGLDMGVAKNFTSVSFAPRSGFASRMVGGIIQASNSPTFSSGDYTLYTIKSTPATGVLTHVTVSASASFRYIRYVGPANGYCNVAELQFFGTGPTAPDTTGGGGTTTTTPTQPSTPPSSATTSAGSVSTGGTSWTTYSAAPASGTAPRAVMQVMAPVAMTGIAIDVRALSSTVGYGSAIDSNFQWNFGDPNGEYNTLPGFNATHIYTAAGSYTITLSVTNSLHQTSSVSTSIYISADSRRHVYVNAATGSDNNNGATPATAVQSAGRADALVGANTEVLFERGQTFNLGQAFKLNYHNVLVGAYGSGSQPIINYTAPAVGAVIFTTNSQAAAGVTVQDLTLTTLNGTQPGNTHMPMGVMAGGTDTSVLRMTFNYVEYDVNSSAAPVGLTVEDNSSPINGGLQGYFVWDEASDSSIIGNYVNGSVHEHVVRTSTATQILAYGNTFYNYDGKGGIEIHVGSYAWIDSNDVNDSDIRVGPLGLWGEPVTDTTSMCVIQDNHVNNSDVQVYPGAHDISIRNNIITRPAKQLVDVIGQDGYGRQSADIRILNNTGILTGATGNFLNIENHTLDVLLENNLLVQPNLAVGSYNSAPVFVSDTSLSSDFVYINDNVWQEPKTFYWTANGGINFVGSTGATTNYETPSQWNSQSVVGTDYFSNTPISSNDAVAASSIASSVATPVPGVFADIYGTARPAIGHWTAGAV